ncbi:hypothetical protein FH972_024636 [Carpinus fangiana]|uniref:Uncharacterized protein n=1 Tax=Carpinus fangiana TaxID=176857 RepID=A0A5N6KZ92_9ROSI|nr:hypothetical protein FH972_024636 [Carpinus fangiana]
MEADDLDKYHERSLKEERKVVMGSEPVEYSVIVWSAIGFSGVGFATRGHLLCHGCYKHDERYINQLDEASFGIVQFVNPAFPNHLRYTSNLRQRNQTYVQRNGHERDPAGHERVVWPERGRLALKSSWQTYWICHEDGREFKQRPATRLGHASSAVSGRTSVGGTVADTRHAYTRLLLLLTNELGREQQQQTTMSTLQKASQALRSSASLSRRAFTGRGSVASKLRIGYVPGTPTTFPFAYRAGVETRSQREIQRKKMPKLQCTDQSPAPNQSTSSPPSTLP